MHTIITLKRTIFQQNPRHPKTFCSWSEIFFAQHIFWEKTCTRENLADRLLSEVQSDTRAVVIRLIEYLVVVMMVMVVVMMLIMMMAILIILIWWWHLPTSWESNWDGGKQKKRKRTGWPPCKQQIDWNSLIRGAFNFLGGKVGNLDQLAWPMFSQCFIPFCMLWLKTWDWFKFTTSTKHDHSRRHMMIIVAVVTCVAKTVHPERK